MNIVEEYISINKVNNIEFRYSYRLINKKFHGITAYGIEIERKDYIGGKNIKLERDKIDMISPKLQKVKGLLLKLYNNQLSPIHLIDVAGVYADDNVGEFDTEERNRMN